MKPQRPKLSQAWTAARTGSAAVFTGTGQPPPGLEVIDVNPVRVRRPLDLVRLTVLLLAGLLLTGLGLIASDTGRGVNDDLVRLLANLPPVLTPALRTLAAFAALALTLAFMVREIVRSQTRRLIEALLTGMIAIAVVRVLDRLIEAFASQALQSALIRPGLGDPVRPLDTYLAALLAFVAVVGVAHDPRWRSLLISVTALYVVSVLTSTRASLLSLLLSMVVGATVGIAVRYLAGSVNKRPDARQVAAALAGRGILLRRLERIRPAGQEHRSYLGVDSGGRQLKVHVLDRDLVASGAVYNAYRLLRIRAEIASSPALSLERLAEHRSLMAMATAATGVATPRLLAGVRCGADAIVLVYERVAGSPLREPTDQQLDELWASVLKLHRSRITHPGLRAANLLVEPGGSVLLPIPQDGTAFATDLRINLDRAELLISTVALVGVQRAVRSARGVLTDDELAATVAVLQPIALSRQTREAIREDPDLMEALREEIEGQTHQLPPEPVRVERVRPRTIISVVAVIVAGYLIVGQLGSVDLVTVLASARWEWLPLVLAASAASYLAAALSLTGYVGEKLSFARTVLAQLAASFAGFVTPPAVGGLAVNLRYLRKAGLRTAGAATSVGMAQVVNGASHVVLLIAFAAATGVSSQHEVPIPGWAFGILGALGVLVSVTLAVPAARRWLLARLLPPLHEALPRLLHLLTSPAKLTQGVLGALLLNGSYIAALWFSVLAFDGEVPLAQVAVVYLAGAAIGSVAPTPGGLGAVEIALSTGLAAAGMPSAAAISAVLLYRLATFWLPVPAGWLAMRWLLRREAL
ncbi:MAG TPA: lysylphosphatidylglycerol synthase transmembrane domain-containing protein [Jatrophihabitans sp.]|uniref:flippase-like domain-containing protein n=1 Tax=Jatrophihabitans sp. TaxID=1932789 RepID=UPI002EFCF46C